MNGLAMAVRRNRIDLDRVPRFAADLASLPIRIEPPHAPAAWNAVIGLVTKHKFTVYDVAYLELAQRTGLPLATLDGDLREAAQAEGVPLVV
jgi:predicted nucleic acid-binding protein